MDEWKAGWVDGRMDGQMDGCMEGRKDGCMERSGWIDVWKEVDG